MPKPQEARANEETRGTRRGSKEVAMVSLQECMDLSGLDEEAVEIIARRRHVPDIVAVEMGYSLSRTPEGVRQLRRLIRDDLKRAAQDGDLQRSLRLSRILARFNARYRAPALRT